MLIEQHVPMATACAGPKKIVDRMGGFDFRDIADYDPDKFAALYSEKPGIHYIFWDQWPSIQVLTHCGRPVSSITASY